jgi:hypothetical protein
MIVEKSPFHSLTVEERKRLFSAIDTGSRSIKRLEAARGLDFESSMVKQTGKSPVASLTIVT